MAAASLLSVSVGGVAASLVIWVTRGWVDALTCYVATILALGALLLLAVRSGLSLEGPGSNLNRFRG
jgi:hypothetical protein